MSTKQQALAVIDKKLEEVRAVIARSEKNVLAQRSNEAILLQTRKEISRLPDDPKPAKTLPTKNAVVAGK